MNTNFSESQNYIIHQPLSTHIFLRGPSGTGKTTAAIARLEHLLKQGVAGDSILLITPQRILATPYLTALAENFNYSGGEVHSATLGGLARRMVELFWPQISAEAGFIYSQKPPTFLTLETTQYFIARLVQPLLEEGFFSSITMDRNRLYSQIVDNLNKAAVVGFPYTQIGERLKAAWNGDPAMLRVYDDAQYCASLFRDFCLRNNLLDFSLQVETFYQYVWSTPMCRNYLVSKYRHLLVDNSEEDTSVTHDILAEWVDESASALVIYDEDGGYRRFLGANPATALTLEARCDLSILFTDSFVMSPPVQKLSVLLRSKIKKAQAAFQTSFHDSDEIACEFEYHRFFPAMLDWVCRQVAILVHEQRCPPGEIVILAPFLSDSLRFSLITRLEEAGVPARSHRPSRALRDEPVTQCLLTLALLAHPDWLSFNRDLTPSRFDVAYALMQAIEDLDPVRAQILTSIVYRDKETAPYLSSFNAIKADMQERISYRMGEKYETLRTWLMEYQQNPVSELDYFISLLFGEVLSQRGFGFFANFQAGEITANLIESIQKFRRVIEGLPSEHNKPPGLEYIEMIRQGVIAAQYLRSWESWSDEAVLVAPAYTFLMYNQPVDFQFWLDPGSRGWSERLYQPLTQPYVLSRDWEENRVWNDQDEVATSEDALYRLVTGLLRRCRKKIYLGLSEISEQGYEQRGPLLHVFQRVFQERV